MIKMNDNAIQDIEIKDVIATRDLDFQGGVTAQTDVSKLQKVIEERNKAMHLLKRCQNYFVNSTITAPETFLKMQVLSLSIKQMLNEDLNYQNNLCQEQECESESFGMH